ncbi:hypothetical protein ICC40_002313 [Salmonella enterica]|nr:hypothetical protein [Salmonella enterica]
MSHKVFPAPAGINRDFSPLLQPLYRVPRASGDKPDLSSPRGVAAVCSPRQRG